MVAELLYGRADLKDLLNTYHDQELMHMANESVIENCKLCDKPLRPWRFIRDFSITYCPNCNGCWCDVCEGERYFGSTHRGKVHALFFVLFSFNLGELWRLSFNS